MVKAALKQMSVDPESLYWEIPTPTNTPASRTVSSHSMPQQTIDEPARVEDTSYTGEPSAATK
jgi:hypothetical protein